LPGLSFAQIKIQELKIQNEVMLFHQLGWDGMDSQFGAVQGAAARVSVIDAPSLNTAASRLMSVDLLRGIIMVIMALDHVRDYMSWRQIPPEVLESHNSFALFFTRWITHFCAPTFFFLAGTGAFLMLARRSKAEVSRFLWTRGLWLIFLECTLIWFAWTFIPSPGLNVVVIFALGLCMIILSGLIHIPLRWLAALSLLVIALHNVFDYISASGFHAPLRQIWILLHEQGMLKPPPNAMFFVIYPIVPWFAVMAAGYCFGGIVRSPREVRVRYTAWIGAAATFLFVVLRGIDHYGNGSNPNMIATGHWHSMSNPLMTLAAFLNTTKYPPSLDYLLMTLGPALLALALFDRLNWGNGWLTSKLVVFGRVPMFYYVCHLFVVHLVALGIATIYHEPAKQLGWRGGAFFLGSAEPGFGFNLPMIYFAWVLSIVILYFPCAWYARYKAQHKENVWLSYL
jgi:uncharacterized membrane protein